MLGPLIKSITKDYGIETSIEIGAGQGYLSQFLHFNCGLDVVSIDSSAFHSNGAEKRKEFISKHSNKKESKNELKILTQFISPEITEKEFSEIISPHTLKQKEVLLASLHSCGDLTTSSIKLTSSLSSIKAFVGVGCCYHKTSSLGDPENKKFAFPISQHMTSNNVSLNGNALQTACQALDMYENQKNVDRIFKKHLYRSMLQVLLYKRVGKEEAQKIGVRNIGGSKLNSFSEYVQAAVSKLYDPTPSVQKNINSITNEDVEEVERTYGDKICRVIAFWLLKASLAPVIESLVLCDRMIYFAEHNFDSILLPLFDSKISPRNFVICAVKK